MITEVQASKTYGDFLFGVSNTEWYDIVRMRVNKQIFQLSTGSVITQVFEFGIREGINRNLPMYLDILGYYLAFLDAGLGEERKFLADFLKDNYKGFICKKMLDAFRDKDHEKLNAILQENNKYGPDEIQTIYLAATAFGIIQEAVEKKTNPRNLI